MNYFDDWYTRPIDNEEEDQEKRWALLLQAAADAGHPDYEPQEDQNVASDQDSFHPRSGSDLIRQILNRNTADINLGLGDTKDLPSGAGGAAHLFGRPADAVDPFDLFDRKAPVNSWLDLPGSAGLDDDFWGGLHKGSWLEAELPRISFAGADLLGFLGSDKHSKTTDSNSENKRVPTVQELMPTYEECQKFIEQLAEEERNKRFTKPVLDNLPRQQSYQDWLTEKLKPVIDLLPRKADGSPDWPSINFDIMTPDQIAGEKANWAQDQDNRGKEWDRNVKHLGRFGGQDYYAVYKYDVKTRPIKILEWDRPFF